MNQNGKGDRPRNNYSQKFRDNYDKIKFKKKNMNYYLFLDDFRKPYEIKWIDLPLVTWNVARSYEAFVEIVNKNGIPRFVTYDHDLGEQAMTEAVFQNFLKFDYSKITEKTGLDCAKFLVEKCMDLKIKHPEFAVHSMNPIGKENIESYINSYNKSLENE